MKKTAIAPANIAFIKYWGKQDEVLRLPLNSSISMNLSAAYTTTTVEFSESLKQDEIGYLNGEFSEKETAKISAHLDRIRQKADKKLFAKVVTQNSFPKGTGIASSASGFAALTVAASAAIGLTLSEKELTILARLGSGSAARSIPQGFVLWKKGTNAESSYAHSLFPENYWDLRDIICVVSEEMKRTSSSFGMENAQTSPFLPVRLKNVEQWLVAMQAALTAKNFTQFGELLEADALEMHAVALTQKPAVLYWSPKTIELIHLVAQWRSEDLAVYATIDAGPNVHLICEGKNEKQLLEKLHAVVGIKQLLVNKPAKGARIIEEHLF